MNVSFSFDPMCPYAHQTSKWMREIRDSQGVEVEWLFFSLEEVNREEGKKHPWERPWSYGWGQMRVGALLRREQGNEELGRWYEVVGRSFFEDGVKTFVPEVHAELLGDNGFDSTLVERAIADESTSAEVRAEHEHAATAYGTHGVPTIVFEPGPERPLGAGGNGYAVYGPVVVPAPTGDDALALWDLVKAWERFPHLYEIRHPKTMDDMVHIGSSFNTYLTTRAWRTIENPAP